MSYNQERVLSKRKSSGIDEGQDLASRDIGSTSSKPSSPSEEPDSRILRGYCGAKEFVIPTHFALGPMPRIGVAEDMQRKSKWPKDTAEDDSFLGIPKRS